MLFLLLTPIPLMSATWSGFLVNGSCYAALERNVNPRDNATYVDRDMTWQLRYCSPNAKTRNFALVQEDWSSLTFDAAGDAKAAELFRKSGKKTFFRVVVNGERNKDTIQTESISLNR